MNTNKAKKNKLKVLLRYYGMIDSYETHFASSLHILKKIIAKTPQNND